jgi:predicted enzyme related to lactoylglutathione lyase
MTGEPALDHVQIAAPPGCEEQARAFYGEVIGLTELPKPVPLRSRGGVWFALAGAQLHVGIEDDFRPARKAHPAFCFTGDGLRAVAERVAAAGAPVSWDEQLPEVLRFFTDDPWDNRLELLAHRAYSHWNLRAAPCERQKQALAQSTAVPPTLTAAEQMARPRSASSSSDIYRSSRC